VIKKILLLAFLFCSLLGAAQNTAYKGLLWKITGNGTVKPSYLYGTMHVSNKVAFHLSDSFYKAIAGVDVVALEINPETWMQTMTSDAFVADRMGNVFGMRGDYSNNGFYSALFKLDAPSNKEIGSALGSELGILNSLLYRTDNYGAEFQEDTYLDLFIYQAGKKQGKQITGLEQLGTTMRLGELAAKPETDKDKKKANRELAQRRKHEIEKLLQGKNFNEVMEDAYRKGDLDLLDSLSRMSGGTDAYHDYIIVHRNLGMAAAMDSIMKSQALFAGIGAAHLPNSYGVITLLREMGYTVEPVNDEKTEFGRKAKDKLEETFITQSFSTKPSFDGSFIIDLPGPLYEFPEANNGMMAAYPDMANGATYVLTRLFTFAPLYGLTPNQYLVKIDSLLFENIPGKIISKKEIVLNGVNGFEISNQTKKGDFQHYLIMAKPLEIMIYKVGGKKEFVNRKEVVNSFTSFGFSGNDGKLNAYKPKNNAYQVNMPGTMLYEAENNAFERGFWKKTVQSYSSQLGYFLVLNRSFTDFEYIEEDSFELSQISRNFVEQFQYQVSTWRYDSVQNYDAFNLSATKTDMPNLYVKTFLAGDQYYLLAAQTDDEEATNAFFSSFKLQQFEYQRPFETIHDSGLYFSVKTNVHPKPANYNEDFYYYRSNADEDVSHQEEEKRTTYYCKSSDEAILVNYKKFHKYYSEPVIDSLWSANKRKLLEGNTFYTRNEKVWQKEKQYIQEIELSDTNSQRTILVRNILNNGVMYSLNTEIDFAKPRTKFVEQFFNTFTPWDTIIGSPILQNKASLFLANLQSEDSITREAAYRSFYIMEFEDEDVPKLIKAYKAKYDEKHSLQIRAQLLSALGGLKHPQILPFLERTYAHIGDSIQFQVPILSALSQNKTAKSAKLFAELITKEAPLSSYLRDAEELFSPFYDSIALTKELFPTLLKLASLPEYKSSVYSLLAAGVSAKVVKPRAYKKYVSEILWEASNELKRQKSKESMNGLAFLTSNSRSNIYGYSAHLERYFTVLMPFYKNKKVTAFYKRAGELQSPGVKMDLAVLNRKYNVKQADNVWLNYSKSSNDKIELYQRLQQEKLLEYYPTTITREELVVSLFAQRAFLNLEKDSLVLVKKEWLVLPKDTGYIYFFKSKSKDADDWEYGYIGPIDSSNIELKRWGYKFEDDFGFNRFEAEEVQLKMALLTLQMKHRERYRVSDEQEFKNLQSGRSRYRY